MVDCDAELDAVVTDVDGIPACMEKHGVTIIRGLLSESHCQAARSSILQHHANADAEASETGIARWFSQRYPFRDDLLLPTTLPPVKANLECMLGPLTDPLTQLLGEEAMCTELAAHISKPGAAANSSHRDHGWTQSRHVVTCFAAMQDVPDDLGPTEVALGTHEIPGNVEEVMSSSGRHFTQLRLRCGDVALMDARVIHRGGARSKVNRRGNPVHRVLFYVSWRDGSWNADNDDFTPSLLREYADRLPLKSSSEWLANGPLQMRQPLRVELWASANASCRAPAGGYPQELECGFREDDVDTDDIPEDAEALAEMIKAKRRSD